MSGIQLKSQKNAVRILEVSSRIIAYGVCVGLLMSAAIITILSFKDLFSLHIETAIQDGLFVLILLEMFYVVRSFMKYGSINVGLVINVGIIATIKEVIFQLNSMTLQLAIGFGVLLATMAVLYYVEFKVFNTYKQEKKKEYLEQQ